MHIAMPAVEGRTVADLHDIEHAFRLHGTTQIQIHLDAHTALERALAQARESGALALVTGSLYLVGTVRERYWPEEKILRLQRNL